MDERVKKLKSPKECEIFSRNAEERGHPELAAQAREKALELRAEEFGAKTQAEKEALQAIYAYEEVLSKKHGKRIRANRTWPMVERHGIIEAVERAVNRSQETQGYEYLFKMGLKKFAFEAVILRHRDVFSASAIKRAEERIKRYERLEKLIEQLRNEKVHNK